MEAGVILPPSTQFAAPLRTDAPSQASAPATSTLLPEVQNRQAVEKHVIAHVGRPSLVLGEEISHAIELEVLAIPPREGTDFWTLVTNGMSSRALHVKPGPQHFSRLELMLCLPADWPISAESVHNEYYYWPIRLLKRLARYPHLHRTPFDWGQVTPHEEDQSASFAQGVPFCGSVLGYPTHFGPQFEKLMLSGHEIHFLAVYPLYKEEMELARRKGADALFKRMAPRKISEVIDLGRANTCDHSAPRRTRFAE